MILRNRLKVISNGLISILFLLGLSACNSGSESSSTQSPSLTAMSNDYAYIVNLGSNTVSMYSMDESGSLTPLPKSTVATGGAPISIAVDPSHRYAYVVNSVPTHTGPGNTVSMYSINQSTGELSPLAESTIATDAEPGSITMGRGGQYQYAYVTTLGKTIDIYKLDPATGELESSGTASTDSLTRMMTIDESGAYAYVVNVTGSITSYSIDATTGQLTELKTKTLVTSPWSIALSKSGQYAYVLIGTGSGNGNVYAYTVNQGVLSYISESATGTNPASLTLDPSGEYVYVTNSGSNSVSEYSINADGSLNLESTIATDISAPTNIKFDKSGKYMYVMSQTNNTVSMYSMLNITSWVSQQTIGTGNWPVAMTFVSN